MAFGAGPTALQGKSPLFRWRCVSGGRKHGHLDESAKGIGLFGAVTPGSWPALLHLIVMLRRNDRLVSIASDLKDAFNIHGKHTLQDWRRGYQAALRDGLVAKGALAEGGPG